MKSENIDDSEEQDTMLHALITGIDHIKAKSDIETLEKKVRCYLGNMDTPINLTEADACISKALEILVGSPNSSFKQSMQFVCARHKAVITNTLEVFDRLMKAYGENVDAALLKISEEAAGESHLIIAKLLLERGANKSVLDGDKRNPLHLACMQGNDMLVKLLLDSRAQLENKDKEGMTPLHHACRRNLELVKILLSRGASLFALDNRKWAPLHYAVKANNTALVQFLIDKRAHLGGFGEFAPLHICAINGFTELMQLLLARGAPVDEKDSYGKTPLIRASEFGKLDAAALLIKNNADIKARIENKTPQQWARESRHTHLADFLQEKEDEQAGLL